MTALPGHRLGLPAELRRAPVCTNAIENALGTVRTEQRNVKRWRNAEMALRWTATGLLEAKKTFRRLKAYRQLPVLDALQDAVEKAKRKGIIYSSGQIPQGRGFRLILTGCKTAWSTSLTVVPSGKSSIASVFSNSFLLGR